MTSKIRFLCDGAGGVYPQCYFSQLSFPVPSPLGPLKPSPGVTDLAFRPQSAHFRQDHHRPATTVQLLTRMQSIYQSIDVRGSERGAIANLHDNFFQFGRSELTAAARNTAIDIARTLQRTSARQISVKAT